jgi:RNA polymerase I-specific transcription initiation factor RRN6
MDDHRTNALQYGHLGSATYLSDVQVWEFSRKIKEGEIMASLKS